MAAVLGAISLAHTSMIGVDALLRRPVARQGALARHGCHPLHQLGGQTFFDGAVLGWLFIGWLFKPYLPPDRGQQLHCRADPSCRGASCTAQWCSFGATCLMGDGHRHFTAEPGRSHTMLSWYSPLRRLWLFFSASRRSRFHGRRCFCPVGLYYIVVPGDPRRQIARRAVLASGGEAALVRLLAILQPISLLALLATLVLLFGFQGEQIIAQPLIIACWPSRS